MPLPPSGPLSLNDIRNEFGGSNPVAISNYYAGGPYVPAGTSGTFGPVPTNGTISIANFYGTQQALEIVTMNVGDSGDGAYGYNIYLSIGSISPNTMVFLSNGYCDAFYWSADFGLVFNVQATGSSGAFTTLIANGTSFSSGSASFFSGDGFSQWVWHGVDNPLGTSGTIQCVFV
jgi:hypothetical protein